MSLVPDRLLAVIVSLGLLVAAEAAVASLDPAQVQARLEDAKARLQLTPEQEVQWQPVMEERAQKLKAIRDQHAADTSRKAKRAMYQNARSVQDDYERKVRTILTDEQEREWEKMRREAREELKARYREGKAPQ